jgi:aerobic carbon-monoxide dehydrogenase small subunit
LLSGSATISLADAAAGATSAAVGVTYALRGALAQLARPAVVQAVAADIAATVAGNLERRLAGTAGPAAPAQLSALRLLARLLWRRLGGWLGRS